MPFPHQPLKHTQSIPRADLKKLLAVARGDVHPDYVIQNIDILDLVNGDLCRTNVAISGAWIAGIGDYIAPTIIDGTGQFMVPGFIDGHTHIESSMMHPFEFECMTLSLGTTSAICDPHEITNVMGRPGIDWFIRCSEQMHQNLFVQVSSCVPALPGFETNGHDFSLADMTSLQSHPHVLGLAEMMNYPGVIHGDDTVLDKLEAFAHMQLDGHAPTLRGKDLNAYRVAGIENCHESISLEEAKEKLQMGMAVMLREGSVAKNLHTLAPLVTAFNSSQCLLCTDDRNPFEIAQEGHINYMLQRLMGQYQMPPHVAYRLSSYAAAKHFGLKRLGLIAPGYRADFIMLNNLETVDIHAVYTAGKNVATLNLAENVQKKLHASTPPLHNTMQRQPVNAGDFSLPPFSPGIYNIMGVIPEQITTHHYRVPFDGTTFQGLSDVAQIAVVERHGFNQPIAHGLVSGFALTHGAIASSVAHDSHNIIVIGKDPADMAIAANTLIDHCGGFTVVSNGAVLSTVPLPIAGLMSLDTAPTLTAQLIHIKQACHHIGITLHEPFLQMAFLSLPVIPTLKITDKGLMNVSTFTIIPLKDPT